MYLMLLFYLVVSGELKIKLMQYFVKELCLIGLQFDVLVCCSEQLILEKECVKIVLFCNVWFDVVILVYDLKLIYEVFLVYYCVGLDQVVLDVFQISFVLCFDMLCWEDVMDWLNNVEGQIKVVIVGKYIQFEDVYKLIFEVLIYGGMVNCVCVKVDWVDSEKLEGQGMYLLDGYDGIIVFGGFGECGIEGMVVIVKYVCEKKVFYLGICLGMQMVVIEVVCNLVDMFDVGFEEFDYEVGEMCFILVVYYFKEWVQGNYIVQCKVIDDKGGIMCLGVYIVVLVLGLKIFEIYDGVLEIEDCYCYCYEVDGKYCDQFEVVGLFFLGMLLDGCLLEVVEYCDYLWFIGVQLYLELKFKFFQFVLLFVGFVCVVMENEWFV